MCERSRARTSANIFVCICVFPQFPFRNVLHGCSIGSSLCIMQQQTAHTQWRLSPGCGGAPQTGFSVERMHDARARNQLIVRCSRARTHTRANTALHIRQTHKHSTSRDCSDRACLRERVGVTTDCWQTSCGWLAGWAGLRCSAERCVVHMESARAGVYQTTQL